MSFEDFIDTAVRSETPIDSDMQRLLGIVEIDISTDTTHPDADECNDEWRRQ